MIKKTISKNQYLQNIDNYIDDCCFDIQGISTSSSLSDVSEAQLAKIITKIVVGLASAWWSILEFREFLKNKKIGKGF